MFDLNAFIGTYVTGRKESMFRGDLKKHHDALTAGIRGKRVCVIGGAGSIGSSFIRALLPYEPSELVIVDTNENALTELTRDLRSSGGYMPPSYLSYPMDYASAAFRHMFTAHGGFHIVANFSAHKHVRSEKDIYSVEALFTNNVLHAVGLLELLEQYPPEKYFCVSTDKAANPVNLMGASKRIMEDLIFSRSEKVPVSTARFANVAFSNGSLPDGFLHRLAKRQPLSAPSDVRRYFVSPEESGQICLIACVLGKNREIFFPKLEEVQMKRFDEIAEDLLKAYGYRVLHCESDEEAIAKTDLIDAGEYPVHFFTSDTSGEKAFEEFFVEGEATDTERFAALGVITGKEIPSREGVDALVEKLDAAFASGRTSKEDIVTLVGGYLPNFSHIETGKSLDSKM